MSQLHEQITAYARAKRLSPRTMARWQAWDEEDRVALWGVVQELRLGENHLRDFLDWFGEITARDGSTVPELLARAEISQPLLSTLSRNDKLKAVKEAVRKIRYPRFSRLEEEVRAGIKALDLGNRIQLSFPPTLEGEEMTIEIKAHNPQELLDHLNRLQQRVADGSLMRLFALFDEV